MTNGWIKLHRKFLNWEWYDDGNMVRLFLHLILKANHKEKNWHGVTIKRGQVLTGRKSLAKELHLSEQTVRTCLTKLKSTSEITTESTNQYTLITIRRYNRYQIKEDDTNQQNNQPIPNEQPTTNQRLTTTKNVKNEENERISYSTYGDYWNELCHSTGLTKVRAWNDQRKQALRSRLKDKWFAENWKGIFSQAHSNTWCREHPKQANILHVLRPNNALKYYEAFMEDQDRRNRRR